VVLCQKNNRHDGLTSQKWYQQYSRFVQLKGLGERSIKSYLGWIRQLHDHYPDHHLPDLKSGEVLDFLLHLQAERNLAGSTTNQALCALRTFYRDHLGFKWKIWSKVKIRREEPLPHVLTREEIARLLRTFRDGRYRAYFTLVYHTGLRLSEALALHPKDIDSKRFVVHVRHGKGGKPREVPIAPALVDRLRVFWEYHRNKDWLFPGVGRGWKSSGITIQQALHDCQHHMTKASIWSAIKIASAESGLSKHHQKITTHTLRHSYATHMLEGGTQLHQLSAYLGHSTLKPTLIYLHLTAISEEQARVALATLPGV
jgi:integrase